MKARAMAATMAVALGAVLPAASSGIPRRARDTAVPILMYHVVADPPRGAPFPELYVDPAEFAAEMGWLETHRFRVVTLRAVYDHWTRGAPLPPRPIVISFDDGYRSTYTAAFPVLNARHWPGVLNLKVGNETVSWGLSPRRIRRLVAAGWEIDAHTLTHPDLTTISASALRREVEGSRLSIHREFGVPAYFFCYPAGRYDAEVIEEVRRAGYLGATTTNFGLAVSTEMYALRRVRVSRSDGVRGFARKLKDLGLVRAG